MEAKDIEQILERYWQCETSQEEERQLQSFFSGDDIPEQWKSYQALFAWKARQAEIKAGKQLKKQVAGPLRVQLYPLMKIAATVLLALTAGVAFYTHYEQNKNMDKMFSETYSDPQDAIRETQEALGKISASLLKVQDLIEQEDSIESEVLETSTEADSTGKE